MSTNKIVKPPPSSYQVSCALKIQPFRYVLSKIFRPTFRPNGKIPHLKEDDARKDPDISSAVKNLN